MQRLYCQAGLDLHRKRPPGAVRSVFPVLLPIAADIVSGAAGARDRTRTGTELPPRDFLTHYGLRRCWSGVRAGPAFGVWTFSSPCRARRGRWGPSSLYTFLRLACAGGERQPVRLSSGLQARPPGHGTGSPNLTPFTPAVSLEPGAQFSSSPLRLPISPPGHWGQGDCSLTAWFARGACRPRECTPRPGAARERSGTLRAPEQSSRASVRALAGTERRIQHPQGRRAAVVPGSMTRS